MSLMAASPADAARRTGLRRMRLVALGLLAFAAAVFLATLRLDHDGVWGYVNTAAEAAMVGALADWFAVTALFRHPLGIPIPHTAVVVERKDQFASTLGEFISESFLTPETIVARVRKADFVPRLATWLREEDNAQRVAAEALNDTPPRPDIDQ